MLFEVTKLAKKMDKKWEELKKMDKELARKGWFNHLLALTRDLERKSK